MVFLMIYLFVVRDKTLQDNKTAHDKEIEKTLILKEIVGEDTAKIQFLKAQLVP